MTLKTPEITQKYSCNYCGLNLSKNCHLHRHLKTCKVKKEYDESERLKDLEIEKLKEEVNKLKSQQSNTTNNININTTKIDEIIHNIVTDIFLETDTMIPLDSRERKKMEKQ